MSTFLKTLRQIPTKQLYMYGARYGFGLTFVVNAGSVVPGQLGQDYRKIQR